MIILMAILDVLSTWVGCVLWLIAAHCLVEYCLQNNKLSEDKNPRGRPLNGIDYVIPPHDQWWLFMAMHCYLHALGVFLITKMLWVAVIQFVVHGMIDSRRCTGVLSATAEHALYGGLIALFATAYTIQQFHGVDALLTIWGFK